jgi:hypothetical protein
VADEDLGNQDINLRVGITGAEETAAELDNVSAANERLAGSTQQTAAAQETAADTSRAQALADQILAEEKQGITEASFAQAAAQGELDRAQDAAIASSQALTEAEAAATASMIALGEAMVTGGAAATAAYRSAQNAVGGLEAAIEAAKAAGAPVSAGAVAMLAEYDAKVRGANAALLENAAATKIASGGMRNAGIEAGLMRGNIMGLASSMRNLAGSNNEFVASLAKAALPIGAAIGAMMLLDKIAAGLKTRGVDMTSFGDVTEAVMDKIAQAVGGTSKAMATLGTDFDAVTQKAQGAISPQERFVDVAGRLSAAGIDVSKTMQSLTKATADAGEALTTTALALGGPAATASYNAAARTADDYRAAIENVNRALNTLAIFDADAFKKQQAAFIDLARAAESGQLSGEKLLAAIKSLATEASAATAPFEAAAKALEKLGPAAQKAFTDYTASIGPLITEYSKLQAAGLSQDQINQLLGPEYQKLAKDLSLLSTEVINQTPKLKDNADMIRKLAGDIDPYMEKAAKLKDTIANLSRELQTQTKAYVEHRAAIEADADNAIKKIDAQTRQFTGSLQEQTDRLNAAYQAGQISQEEYNAKIEELGAKRRAALNAESTNEEAIRKKEQSQLDDLQTKYEQTVTKIGEALGKLHSSFTDAAKVQAELDAAAKPVTDHLTQQADTMARLVTTVPSVSTSTKAFGEALKELEGHASTVMTALDSINAKLLTITKNGADAATSVHNLSQAITGQQ